MTTTSSPKNFPTDLIPTVENVVRVFLSADEDQMVAGLDWYAEAHRLAVALDPKCPARSAGVISAFSPMTPWARNQTLAVNLYATKVAAGYTTAGCRKAQAIFDGDGSNVAEILNAPKTTAFAATIADPTDPNAVVIDRHAMSVAIDKVTTDDDTKYLSRKGAYEMYAETYREAARRLGYSPSQVQAVTWVVWRQTKIRTSAAVRRAERGE